MARIVAPTPFTGAGVGGVEFVDGVAETDNHAVIEYCRGAGYVIEGANVPAEQKPAPAPRKRATPKK